MARWQSTLRPKHLVRKSNKVSISEEPVEFLRFPDLAATKPAQASKGNLKRLESLVGKLRCDLYTLFRVRLTTKVAGFCVYRSLMLAA